MRKMVMAWILPFVLLGSCDKELVEYEKGSVESFVRATVRQKSLDM